MNKRRLNTIVADLRFVAGESGRRRKAKLNGVTVEFDMGSWCSSVDAIHHHVCETRACAIGTHCLMHPRASLKLKQSRCRTRVALGRKLNTDAIAAYLDIHLDDALDLFNPINGQHLDATPAQMARVLETYRDTHDAEKALEVLR